MSQSADLTHVFAFTDRRDEIADWFEDVLGLPAGEQHDDSVWFATEGARLVVHDRGDKPRDASFVPWFHVDDVVTAYERVRSRGANVGQLRDGYFLARDPDGGLLGVRRRAG